MKDNISFQVVGSGPGKIDHRHWMELGTELSYRISVYVPRSNFIPKVSSTALSDQDKYNRVDTDFRCSCASGYPFSRCCNWASHSCVDHQDKEGGQGGGGVGGHAWREPLRHSSRAAIAVVRSVTASRSAGHM